MEAPHFPAGMARRLIAKPNFQACLEKFAGEFIMLPDLYEKILAQHELWFKSKGMQGERANLSSKDFSYQDLRNRILVEADLRDSNLESANLDNTDLRGASMQDCKLTKANLSHANLEEADLMWADFTDANLHQANLEGANVQGADFTTSRGLTRKQLQLAIRDDTTLFPKEFFQLHKDN
jgi:uncharacterized protein YjbI with pentapeptide repeats